MKRISLVALAAAVVAVPGAAALTAGSTAPDFKAQASLAGKAQQFSLSQALKKGPVVVYFYPAAFTGGCNMQARAFADRAAEFAKAHTTVLGVSGDSITRLNAFSADPQYCGGKFPVASDADGAIARTFDLKVSTFGANPGRPAFKDSRGVEVDNKVAIERTTFVITPDRKIVGTFRTAEDKLSMQDHAIKTLAMVQSLPKKR
jgi:peroxiredoxin